MLFFGYSDIHILTTILHLLIFRARGSGRSTENGCMDPKSGVFEVPITGVYFFTLHVCTHDLKKALLSIRKNGVTELASLYDQNHSDNHKVTSDTSSNDLLCYIR